MRRQLPLTSDHFSVSDAEKIVAAKERLWVEHGYGPWAFVADAEFGGWRGLQPEGDDVDLALVLHPRFRGRAIFEHIIPFAFDRMQFPSVTVLFALTRTRIKGLLRLGFVRDGEVEIGAERFLCYRLSATEASRPADSV